MGHGDGGETTSEPEDGIIPVRGTGNTYPLCISTPSAPVSSYLLTTEEDRQHIPFPKGTTPEDEYSPGKQTT